MFKSAGGSTAACGTCAVRSDTAPLPTTTATSSCSDPTTATVPRSPRTPTPRSRPPPPPPPPPPRPTGTRRYYNSGARDRPTVHCELGARANSTCLSASCVHTKHPISTFHINRFFYFTLIRRRIFHLRQSQNITLQLKNKLFKHQVCGFCMRNNDFFFCLASQYKSES